MSSSSRDNGARPGSVRGHEKGSISNRRPGDSEPRAMGEYVTHPESGRPMGIGMGAEGLMIKRRALGISAVLDSCTKESRSDSTVKEETIAKFTQVWRGHEDVANG